MNYRHLARSSVERAKKELGKNKIHRLPYAALELRMALEAIIYERAGNYKEELSGKRLSTWQPRKLLSLLLEIDPYADKGSSLSVGLEEEYGKPAKVMKLVGNERVLSLNELKTYYDRLGAYLHTQTIDQTEQGKGPKPDGIRTRCNELIKILEQVLASSVFNVNFRNTVSILCKKCGAKIVRRAHPDQETFIANCIDCSASYEVTESIDNQYSLKAIKHEINCANESCSGSTAIWENDIKLGSHWKCSECGGKNKFSLGVEFVDQPQNNNG